MATTALSSLLLALALLPASHTTSPPGSSRLAGTPTAFAAAPSALAAAPSPLTAAPEAPPDAWPAGTLEIGVLGGYARGKVYDPQRTPSAFSQLLVRCAVHFGPVGRGRMRGNVAIVAEGVGMAIDQDPAAHGGGLDLLFRYSWAAGRWRPAFLFGAGILFTDERVPPGETTRNYMPQAGVGLQYLVGERLAVGGEYRFHHLSNNSQTDTNPGINSHLVLFGISWFR